MKNIRAYYKYQQQKEDEFESMCKRCGACCGAYDGDPCALLAFDPALNVYYCTDYENRLGTQKTVSGKSFECVSILENLRHGTLHSVCAYNGLRNKSVSLSDH